MSENRPMNNQEFREMLADHDWLSPIRTGITHPVSPNEIECRQCGPGAEILMYDDALSATIACAECNRSDEFGFREFEEHTWTETDRDRYLSSALHTPTLDAMADDDPPFDRP